MAIVATPESAEFWDGNNSLLSSVKIAIAALTGNRPSLGENAKVTRKRTIGRIGGPHLVS
jgi:hypothetical protein